MTETRENRFKRLKMRSWRRGMKEMDLILGPFADSDLETLSEADLDLYEALLEENDQELYIWILSGTGASDRLQPLVARIAAHANARLRPA